MPGILTILIKVRRLNSPGRLSLGVNAMKYSNIIHSAIRLDQITDVINEGGTHLYNSESIAAQYAYAAQIESGYAVCEEAIEAHLDVLVQDGASFDYNKAVEIGRLFIDRGY